MQQLIGPDYVLAECDLESIGAKALNLLRMKEAGLKVPPFFSLSSQRVNQILQPLAAEIHAWNFALQQGDDADIQKASISLQEGIKKLELDKGLIRDIQTLVQQHFGSGVYLAVRSSGSLEDLNEASFAGQYDSFLFVSPADCESAILACIASAFSVGMAHYRRKMKLGEQELHFSVLVQEMIPASSSGVAFSMDQTANLADALIVAAYGLGEGLVANKVESDLYCYNRQANTYQEEIATKSVYLDYVPEQAKVEEKNLDASLRDSSVLSADQVQEVYQKLCAVEQLLEGPADIEFAFDGDSNFWLLQMRPITGVDASKLRILDNTNIVESYPGISKPLTFSLARKAYDLVFASCAKDFWISPKKSTQLSPVFKDLIAHFEGRIYYRLDNWYQLIDLVFKSKKSREAWQSAVGLKNAEGRKVSDIWSLFKMVLASAWMLLRHQRRVSSFFSDFNVLHRDFETLIAQEEDAGKLWLGYEKSTQSLFSIWSITIVNDFLAFKFFGFLQARLKSLGFDNSEAMAHELSTQFEAIESEQAVLHLLELKEQILNEPQLLALFEQSAEEIDRALPSYPDFKRKVDFHRQQYGDRVLAELKLEVPSLRQNPLAVYSLIKSQLNSTLSLTKHKQRKLELRERAWAELKEKISPFGLNYFLIKRLSKWAGAGLRNRENMRFARARAYGRVKQVFEKVAVQMYNEGLLEAVADVFYLDLPDLEAFCGKSTLVDLKQKVHLRKQEEGRFYDLDLPDRISYLEGEVPRFRKARKVKSSPKILIGTPASKGKVKAEAIVVLEPSFDLDVKGKILVCKMTDPAWVFLMTQAAGIISEKGSVLSHTAIVGRELGIPAVVGVDQATTSMKSGQLVDLNADEGEIYL